MITQETTGSPALPLIQFAPAFVPALLILVNNISAAADKPDAQFAQSYPRQELVIEVREVTENKAGNKRVILDTREKEKYLEGHIPGAVWIDSAAWGKAVSSELDPENWTRRFAESGINPDSEVVVYDDQRLRGSARIWWILRLWGIDHVRILNGGWSAYTESAGPIEKDAKTRTGPGTAIAKRDPKVLATKDYLLALHQSGHLGKAGSGNLQLIDTRSTAEFCGTDTSRAKRTGTIPGSVNLEWSELLVPDSSRLKNAAELQQLFASKKIDVTQPAASFCQGGGRAAVTAFVLTLMGSPESRNYYASWGEWGNADDTPVEKPAS